MAPCLTLALSVATGCSAQGAPKVAAEVEGELISGQEVQRLTRQFREAERAQEDSPLLPVARRRPLSEQRLKQLVLVQLIKADLVSHLAEKEGVHQHAGELARSAATEFVSTQFPGWEQPDFEAAVRSSVLSKVLAEKLFPSIQVPEHEARSYFTAHPALFEASWKATVDLAFFTKEADAGRLAARHDATSRFSAAAVESGATKVLTGQAVEPMSPLPAEIVRALGAMGDRTVSAPVPVPNGYWVLHALNVEQVGARSFEEARASIEAHLVDQERQAKFAEWLTGELRKADIRVAATYGRWPQDFL